MNPDNSQHAPFVQIVQNNMSNLVQPQIPKIVSENKISLTKISIILLVVSAVFMIVYAISSRFGTTSSAIATSTPQPILPTPTPTSQSSSDQNNYIVPLDMAGGTSSDSGVQQP